MVSLNCVRKTGPPYPKFSYSVSVYSKLPVSRLFFFTGLGSKIVFVVNFLNISKTELTTPSPVRNHKRCSKRPSRLYFDSPLVDSVSNQSFRLDNPTVPPDRSRQLPPCVSVTHGSTDHHHFPSFQ